MNRSHFHGDFVYLASMVDIAELSAALVRHFAKCRSAGYPKALRETESDRIGAGPYSVLFRITTVGEGYCKCRIERRDLVNFSKDPMPAPGTDIGGVSGGPVLLVDSGYPLGGVVTEHYNMESADLEILQFATLADVKIRRNES